MIAVQHIDIQGVLTIHGSMRFIKFLGCALMVRFKRFRFVRRFRVMGASRSQSALHMHVLYAYAATFGSSTRSLV